MTPFLQLTLALAIMITFAKLGGYLSFRLGQAAVLGELLIGIILGPSILDFLHLSFFTDRHLGEVIQELAELGGYVADVLGRFRIASLRIAPIE